MTSHALIQAFGHNAPGQRDVIAESILLALVYTSVGLRLWSRRLQKTNLQVNDYLILLAVPLITAQCVLEIYATITCGVGLHIKEVLELAGRGQPLFEFQKLLYAMDLLWVSLVSIIKVAILHLYTQIFRRKMFLRVTYVVLGLCVAYWVGAFWSTAFFCDPPQKQWDPTIQGHCGNSNALYTACATADLGLDVLTILLPMPVLWSLHLPKVKKGALMLIFGLGFVIIAITAVRIKYMMELDVSDPTYIFSTIGLLSSLVPPLGIVNASLPVLAPALKKLLGCSILFADARESAKAKRSTYGHRLPAQDEVPLKSTINNNQTNKDDRICVTKEWQVHTGTPSHSVYSQV